MVDAAEILDRLATTLDVLARLGPTGLVVEALWGRRSRAGTVPVTAKRLADVARAGQLGTHTIYGRSRQRELTGRDVELVPERVLIWHASCATNLQSRREMR
jgi:hypothetical protein